MHKNFQILNLNLFKAPQSFKSEKLRVTKYQLKKARIAPKYEPNYISKNSYELKVKLKCSIEEIKICGCIISQNRIMS